MKKRGYSHCIFVNNSDYAIYLNTDSGDITTVKYSLFNNNPQGDLYTGLEATNFYENIEGDPRFVHPGGNDYHLLPCSPCIDTGDPVSDYSLEPEPNGGRINMGAYGNTPEAASYTDLEPDLEIRPETISFGSEQPNPNLGESVTIEAVVNSRHDCTKPASNVPVSFHAYSESGQPYQIGSTQYIDEILPGDSRSVSAVWTNSAQGGYVIEVKLDTEFSDAWNDNNRATRGIVVGNQPFVTGGIAATEKTRVSRTTFRYLCKILLNNISPVAVENIHLTLLDNPDITILDPLVTFEYIDAWQSCFGVGTLSFEVDRLIAMDPENMNWLATYQRIDTQETIQQTLVNMEILERVTTGDLTGDGNVDVVDLAKLASKWLWTGQPDGIPEDIVQDGIVNFLDFAKFAENWSNTN